MSADTAVPGLELVGATRRFAGAQKVTALDSVTLKIEPGEMVGIVGRSGSGKSSLLHVLGLLDVLSAGVYTIAGRDAAALRESERAAMRARTFGFVFQNPHLLASRNARENVELALGPQRCRGEDRRRRAVEALSAVGLEHRLWAFPNTLSGGEAQRLVIARVVAQRARVLLCDEPTGSLDTATAAAVVDLLRDLHQQGLTVVVVTHDRDLALSLPRCVTVADGAVVDDRRPGCSPAGRQAT